MRPLRTAARTMLAALFVVQGWDAFRDPKKLAGAAKPVTDRLAPGLTTIHPKMPTDAETLVRINGATQVAGGVLLATGHATTPAALVLAGSMLPTTLAGHAFWEQQDPTQRAQQRVQFLKNLGLIGGLIFAALDNEGRPGLPWRTQHLARQARHYAGHEARHVAQAVRRGRREARLAGRAARAGRYLPSR